MKKLYAVTVVLALALPALAISATTLKDGSYNVSITSVVPDLNGQKSTATVTHKGESTVVTVKYTDGTREEWTIAGNKLVQKEFDKAGKTANEYAATSTDGKTFNVNCKDKAKNECDAGIDSRNYWVISTDTDGFKYLVYGVSKDKKGDPTAKVEKRHEFAFKTVTK